MTYENFWVLIFKKSPIYNDYKLQNKFPNIFLYETNCLYLHIT